MTALLRREGRDPDVEISVLFCDDPVIHALNRDYRGIDRPTDVLSFGQEGVGSEGSGTMADAQAPMLNGQCPTPIGDIVISLETAERQAAAQGHSLGREVEWLLLHGALHLLGYDDATEEELQGMIERQQAVLEELHAGRRTQRPII